MRTYEVEVHRTMSIKVKSQKKKEAEDVARSIWKLLAITSHKIERYGVLGRDEHKSLSCVIGGYYALPDPATYQKDREAFLASLPEIITEPQTVKAEADRLFMKHVHVDDNRKTPEQAAEEAAEATKIHEELKDRRKKEEMGFISEWGLSEKVAVPSGMMAVYLSLTYDDSDPMSDYYAPHRSVGQRLLLGIVSSQAQTDRLARMILSRYPDLCKHRFTWHSEKYSMGHGNYLISEWTEYKVRKNSMSDQEVPLRFEISFDKYIGGKEMYPYKHYQSISVPSGSSCVAGSAAAAPTMRLNDAKQGVELLFSGTPGVDVLTALHAAGFRFSRRQRIWYAKQSDKTLEVARRLSGDDQPTVEETVLDSVQDDESSQPDQLQMCVASAEDIPVLHTDVSIPVPSAFPLPAGDFAQQSLFA